MDMQALKTLVSAVKSGFRLLVPTCRQVSRLQSEVLDRPLSLPRRFGLRLHLLFCKWCRRYGSQMRFLSRAAHDHPEKLTEATPHILSPAARERLKRSLRTGPE
jgi:hypothetical protein